MTGFATIQNKIDMSNRSIGRIMPYFHHTDMDV